MLLQSPPPSADVRSWLCPFLKSLNDPAKDHETNERVSDAIPDHGETISDSSAGCMTGAAISGGRKPIPISSAIL